RTRSKCGTNIGSWERAERANLYETDRVALGAHGIHDVLDRASGRAEAHDHVLGAVELVELDSVVAAAREHRVLPGDLVERVERRVHRGELLVPKLEVV